jgi:tetratricopeptide (TPR) repeat protein
LQAAGLDKSRLIVIPGNHDVDRDLGIGLARTLGDEADAYFAPRTPKPHITQKLGAFVAWHDRYFEGKRAWPKDSTCGPVIKVGALGILPINSALFCQGDDDHNKLWVGRRCLSAALEELRKLGAEMNVALIHHPLDWLHDLERANIKATLQSHVQFILRGHLHEDEIESVATGAGAALHCAAGAAYQSRKWPNRALYGRIAGDRFLVSPIRYEDSPTEVWTTDASLFPHEPKHEKSLAIPRAEAAAALRREPQPLPPGRSNINPLRWPLVGRDGLIEEIRESKADVLVLHGTAGVGKSELAREFARRERERFPGGTFFLDASRDALAVELARVGKTILQIDFPADLPLADQALRTLHLLASIETLLIYDNVASEDVVRSWLLPAGARCRALITTTNEHWGPGWPCLGVPPLPQADALDLVGKLAGAEVAGRFGKKLAEIAEGLPVQICPAAAALAYEEKRGRLDSAQVTLAEEAKQSFRGVFERLDAPAQLLLHAAAILNNQRIPKAELLLHLKEGAGWAEAEFEAALDACMDLQVVDGDSQLRMHQLFAKFLADDLPAAGERLPKIRIAQRKRLVESARQVFDAPADAELLGLFLSFPGRPDVWEAAGAPLDATDGETVARALYQTGRCEDALPWFRIGVKIKQQGDESGRVNHDDLNRSLHGLGYCLSMLGKYEEAQHWFERAVEEAKEGDLDGAVNHKELGVSLYQVGHCLSRRGQYAEARPWYERAVEEKQKGDIFGRVDFESVALSMEAVAGCLGQQKLNDQAAEWARKAKEARSRAEQA